MGFKTDNEPNPEILKYWNEDGTRNEEGRGTLASSVDPWGNLAAAAGGSKPPADPPDLTDELVRRRRAEEMNRLMLGFGRRSTFTEGGYGDLRLGRKALTGGGNG